MALPVHLIGLIINMMNTKLALDIVLRFKKQCHK